jgi:anti-anti-sigma factor
MVSPGSSLFFTLSERTSLSRGGPEDGLIVMWLWGDHDASTDRALGLALARAIALGGAGIVLDLSEVDSMAPSTLGVIVRAREFLHRRSASLTVRSPSPCARRVIEACGWTELFSPGAGMAAGTGAGLSSWVEVPTAPRSDGPPVRSPSAPERVPASLGPADGR